MYNISSAMANQFADITKEMTEKVLGLGKNPLKNIDSKHKSSYKEK
jgi:hypothetical protein